MPATFRGCSVSRLIAAGFAALCVISAPRITGAQQRTFTACTPDVLGVCTEIRLTAGPSAFEIALRPLGATSSPSMPISVYNLVFSTSAAAATIPGAFMLPPGTVGGASVSDASPWDLFDAGDVLFLSALSNRGIGGCAAGADVGGFGQAALTCGAGQFVTFSFTPTTLFDPAQFTLLNLEAVALSAGLAGASCGGDGAACRITERSAGVPPSTTVPEPATSALFCVGLLCTACMARQRRIRT